eukprot:2316241-Rhodomonas_salina.1
MGKLVSRTVKRTPPSRPLDASPLSVTARSTTAVPVGSAVYAKVTLKTGSSCKLTTSTPLEAPVDAGIWMTNTALESVLSFGSSALLPTTVVAAIMDAYAAAASSAVCIREFHSPLSDTTLRYPSPWLTQSDAGTTPNTVALADARPSWKLQVTSPGASIRLVAPDTPTSTTAPARAGDETGAYSMTAGMDKSLTSMELLDPSSNCWTSKTLFRPMNPSTTSASAPTWREAVSRGNETS